MSARQGWQVVHGSLMPLVLLVQQSYMMDQLEDDQSM